MPGSNLWLFHQNVVAYQCKCHDPWNLSQNIKKLIAKNLKYGAMPWLMAYMALVLAILKFLAILLSGNIAESVWFKSSFARTENPPKADFSVHVISAFTQSALWKCISNVFLTLLIWNNCFSTRFSGFFSLGFWFWFKEVFSFIHYCHMLFSFSMTSQYRMSAGWQLDSFVAISASHSSFIFVFRQPSLKHRIF